MKLLDTNHPFFKPLWIRVLVVAFTSAWAAFEFVLGSAVWGAVFAAFAALSIYGFFIDFDPDEVRGKNGPDGDGPGA